MMKSCLGSAVLCGLFWIQPATLSAQYVADELADAPALERMSDFASLPVLSEARPYVQRSSRDRGVADPLVPVSQGGNRDFNNFVCASADAQVGASLLSPYSFDEPACADDYVRGVVLARFEGSGHMVRSWIGLQSALFGGVDDEILRIYVDDVPAPKVEVPLAAVMDGSAGEVFEPPFGAGSSLRVAWYYPVAFRSKLVVALDRLGDFDRYYHQTDVVLDDAVEPLPVSALPEREVARAQLNAVAAAGESPLLVAPATVSLAAGQAQETSLTGPATIRELRVRVAERDLSRLAQVRVRVRWDGAGAAAIDAPLLSLLGGAVPPERPSLALTSARAGTDRTTSLRLPMPFASSARFAFQNEGSRAVRFELSFRGDDVLPAGPFGRLHTQVRSLRPSSLGSRAPHSLALASATGRGRLVGACLRMTGHADLAYGLTALPYNFLEGDVRATIDGALALDGTGSEEYADDVFYFQDAPHGNAFAQAWGVGLAPTLVGGTASFCRWHVLGTELDFASQLELTLEVGGNGRPEIVDSIDSIAFLYLPLGD